MTMQVYIRKKKTGSLFVKRPEARSDGLLLEIINSIRSSETYVGDCSQRSDVLFVQVAVNDDGDSVVAGDIHGNLYVFELIKNRFSLVKHLSVPSTCINASMKKKTHFLVALSDYTLRCYNIETQNALVQLRGHDRPIMHTSIHSSKRYALSTSGETAFLWNLDTFDRKRKLSISKDVDLLLACFVPNSNSIMTCFKDNTIMIWDAESMELLHELKSIQAYDVDYRTFSCSHTGELVAAAGKSNVVHVWNISSHKIVKILQLSPETKSIKHVHFIPSCLYDEDVLAVVCSNGVLRFIDIKNSKELWTIGSYENKVTQISMAVNNGTLACIFDSGNVNIYDLERVFKALSADRFASVSKDSHTVSAQRETGKPHAKVSCRSAGRLKDVIDQRVENSKTLNIRKLQEILKEFGEFPDKYRTFIWKVVLKVPENFDAYSALLEKGIHPAYADIQRIYPIRSSKLLRVFQRLLSAIAYWAPVVVESTFVPALAFPFAKLLQNNQLLAFEVVATVLINLCQKWFDFIPNPPLNILSMVENVLSYQDRELFQHFIRYRVTTQAYAWSLLQTGFSEVFSRNEWLRFWDHVLINPPSWILMAVVAYSLVNRGPLLDCYESEQFKQFYRYHNGTGVTSVIKETYKIVRTTPTELDPQANLSFFTPLSKGQYQLLAKFPQRVKDFPQNEIARIREEQIAQLQADNMVTWSKR